MQVQPVICVRDVEASLHWYNTLLGAQGTYGGHGYARVFADDHLILQLHDWGATHDHGPIGDSRGAPGNGVLLWFEVTDFEAAARRADALGAPVVLPRRRNPRPNHWELWIRDPDGYTVVLASPDGSAGEPSSQGPARPWCPMISGIGPGSPALRPIAEARAGELRDARSCGLTTA